MLIQAIANDQLKDIPFMKPELVQKFLPLSHASIQSTSNPKTFQSIPMDEEESPLNPCVDPNYIPSADSEHNTFCYDALVDKQKGTFSIDAQVPYPPCPSFVTNATL